MPIIDDWSLVFTVRSLGNGFRRLIQTICFKRAMTIEDILYLFSISRNCEGSYVLSCPGGLIYETRKVAIPCFFNIEWQVFTRRYPSRFLFVISDLDVRVRFPVYYCTSVLARRTCS